MSNNRKKRRSNVIPLATPHIEQTTGDPLFEQPLIDEAKDSAVAATGRSGRPNGGKARAKKLGKAKRSAIAKKVTRSRWKKAR
jgi:hypothetical protein